MLDTLITSKTRIKLLLKFFLNPGTRAYLRSLAEEFDESTNAVRLELNRLHEAGLLSSQSKGRTIEYFANQKNPLFPEVHSIVKKYLGIDMVEMAVSRLGNLELAFISGDYAKGQDNGIIDLVLVGDVDEKYLRELIKIAEENINRKIRTLIFDDNELDKYKNKLELDKAIILWNKMDNTENQ